MEKKKTATSKPSNPLPCLLCGHGFDSADVIPVGTDRLCKPCLTEIERVAHEQRTKKMKLIIEVEGDGKNDLEVGLQAARRRFDEGCLSGGDSNDTGRYVFDTWGLLPSEDPADHEGNGS